jgi:NADPH2:quinone reductase
MLAFINTSYKDKPVALGEVEEPSPAPNEALPFSLNRGELAQLNRLPHGWRLGQDLAGTVVRQASDGSGPPAGARIVGLTEEAGWAERTRTAVRPSNEKASRCGRSGRNGNS